MGHQDAESAGRRLLEGRREVLLGDEAVPVTSHVERFYPSAHADRLGIAQHLRRHPASRLLLAHGEEAGHGAVFELFRKERHVDRPKVGEWVELAGESPYAKALKVPALSSGSSEP